jgi:hypothetical protein
MYLCICEREAEKSDFGSRFWRPFHHTQPVRLAALTFFLGPRRQACKVSMSLLRRKLGSESVKTQFSKIYFSQMYFPMRCMPITYISVRCTPVRYTPTRYTPMRHPPMKVFARTERVRASPHICPSSSLVFSVVTYGFKCCHIWATCGHI